MKDGIGIPLGVGRGGVRFGRGPCFRQAWRRDSRAVGLIAQELRRADIGRDDGGVVRDEFHEHVDPAVHRPQHRQPLQEDQAAVVGQDQAQQLVELRAFREVGGRAVEDDGVAEEEVDVRLDAPADVVLDDHFLAGHVGHDGGVEGVGARDLPRDAAGQAPFLGLAVRPLLAVRVRGEVDAHRIAVVRPQPVEPDAAGGEQFCGGREETRAVVGEQGVIGGEGGEVASHRVVLSEEPRRCAGDGRAVQRS